MHLSFFRKRCLMTKKAPKCKNCGSTDFLLKETVKLTRTVSFTDDAYDILSEEYDPISGTKDYACCVSCSKPFDAKTIQSKIFEFDGYCDEDETN